MKKKKRGLSLVLSVAVVISMLPAGALAAEGDETPVCTCETVCTEGNVNTDCPVCGLEDADLSQCRGTVELASPSNATALSVEDVQKLINALPTVEELKSMDTEEQGTVYTDLQTAYDTYEVLSDEEKQEVTGAEIFDTLFAVFNEMTNVLADSAFNIMGGTEGTNYTYSNGVLTVKNGANLTVSMADGATTPTSDRIVVESGATASITLNGVNITGAGASGLSITTYSAITLSSNSSLTLKLAQGSSNTLAGGSGGDSGSVAAPAIRVPMGTTLTVLCANQSGNDHICSDDCGSLSATGGSSTSNFGGVGIGGGTVNATPGALSTSENCGTVLLLGGNITVSGGNSGPAIASPKDIGGSNTGSGTPGAGGTIIILTSVKKSSGTLNIGAGTGGSGNADNGAGIKPSTSDNTYEVYGNLTLPDNLTIPAGVTVTIPSSAALTVPSDKTLTNNGTIVNNGTITVDSGGTLTNNGDVSGSGTLTNNGTVNKKQQTATAPTAADVTAAETSITVKTVAGQKYACTASDTAPGTTDNCWQTATGSTMTFDNLTAGKTYYIWTYKPGNDYYADSDVVETEINTVPSASAVTIDYTNETISFDDTLEANTSENFDGTPIENNGFITDYIKDTENTIYVRVKGTGDTAASAATSVTIPARPAAPTTVQGGYEKLTGVTAEMQYRTDGIGWQDITGTEVTGLTAGAYYVCYKATNSDFASYATNAVTVQEDETLPTGTITVNENSWKSFINTITFGIFCKDKYDITITATDNETGVSSVEYLLSETAISSEDIKNQTGWQAYPENGFSIEDDGKYIVYAKITDSAAPPNTTYISTDGMVLDAQGSGEPTVKATVDTADSSGTEEYDGGWTAKDVTITVSGSRAVSGIQKYEYSIDGGKSWKALSDEEMTVETGSDPKNVEKGEITISATSATDAGTLYIFRAVSNSGMEGNESIPVVVKIDKTDPTIEVSGNTNAYLQSDTVKITATAGISGVQKVEILSEDGKSYTDAGITKDENGNYTYTVEKNGTYTFRVTNGAGKTAEASITYAKIDKTQPVVSVTAFAGTSGDGDDYTSGEWTNKEVTLSAKIENGSALLGTSSLKYKVNNGDWQDYTGDIEVSEETDGATYTFYATSASGVKSEEKSVIVKLDKTAPVNVDTRYVTDSFREFVNTITFGLFFKDTVEVTISAEDTGSGVKEISYRLGDGELQTATAENGTVTFYVKPQFKGNIKDVSVKDNAGNSTDSREYEYFAVDSAKPGVPEANGGSYTFGTWTGGDVTITVSGASADSGIARYEYSEDGGENWKEITTADKTEATSTQPRNVTKAYLTVPDTSDTEEETSYIFRAVSNSGMEGEKSTPVVVKIDKTDPTIEVSGNTDTYLQSDTVKITATAGVSGVQKVEILSEDGKSYTEIKKDENGNYTYTVEKNEEYTFRVTSGAGKTAEASITYNKIDKTQPVVSVTAFAGDPADGDDYTSGEWTNKDLTLRVSNTAGNPGTTTFECCIDGGEWEPCDTQEPIVISADTSGTTYSFRATSESGVTSDTASITVKRDSTSPEGDVKIKENSIKKLIHEITFGMFFKENIDVTISAQDGCSGVQSVEYYRSQKVLTEEEVRNLTEEQQWTKSDKADSCKLSETAEDAEKFIYYVRITDNAGNETVFGSNGVTFDTTVPVISGIENGKTYCEAQTFTVEETNLESVTVNDGMKTETMMPDKSGNYTLAAENKTYEIVAVDKAGNSTSCTVTVNDGHSWKEATYEWSADGKNCTATRICENDSEHKQEAKGTVTDKQTKPPTCTEKGETTYTADFGVEWAEQQTKVLKDIEATGHSYVHHDEIAAECEKSGMEEQYTCENCDLIFDKDKKETTVEALTISSTGHTFSTEWNKDEEWHWHECSCGETTEKTAHTFKWITDKEAEIGVAGSKHEECTECGYAKEAVEIPALEAPEYPPVIGDTDGGTVAVNPESPKAGEEVTVTVELEDGRTVDKVVVTDENGNEITVTDKGNGTYTFIQPAGKVTVKVTFKTAETDKKDEDKDDKEETAEEALDTGDSSHPILWVAALLISGAVLTGAGIYSRKKKKYRK